MTTILDTLHEEMRGTLERAGADVRTCAIIVDAGGERPVVSCSDERKWVGEALLREGIEAIKAGRR